MRQFILYRILQTLPILLGVSLLTFLMIHMLPGTIADNLVPAGAPEKLRIEINHLYGLDRPLWEQYLIWLKQLLHGNFGLSLVNARPVVVELASALANSLKITIPAALLGFVAGTALGAIAAINHDSWPDRLFSLVTIGAVSVPSYWLAVLLVGVFAFELNWLPAQGIGRDGLPLHWEQWKHMVLPVVTLALIPMGVVGRLVRAATLETLAQEFVVALRGKGLFERQVYRHVARNAAPTILAVMGLQFGYLIGGSLIIETVFNWPGVGKLLNIAIFSSDAPVIQATVLVLSSMFVLINLVVDVLQAAIDPRMRR